MTYNDSINGFVQDAAERAQEHAEEYFPEDASRFTQVTSWDDGDFRLIVWHGCSPQGRQKVYKEAKFIEYYAERGIMKYVHTRRHFDKHTDETLEEEVIEEWP